MATNNAWNSLDPAQVAKGGTGRNTLTSHGVLIGEGTSNINSTAAGTNGQVLIGGTGVDPAFAALTSSKSTIAYTAGSNSLNLDLAAFPSFSAQALATTNDTGNGTKSQIICTQNIVDITSNYSSVTGKFTAPFHGLYSLNCLVVIAGLTSADTSGQLIMAVNGSTNGSTSMLNVGAIAVSGVCIIGVSGFYDLNASDTVALYYTVSGSTQTVGQGSGSDLTTFWGYLIQKL